MFISRSPAGAETKIVLTQKLKFMNQMTNLRQIDLTELSAQEMKTSNGGLLFLAAIPLAKVFMWGVGVGIVAGAIVLDHILDDKQK